MDHQVAQQRRQIPQVAGNEMRHLALPLQRAVHRQEARAQEFAPLPLGEIAPDHDVDVSGLVFEREEGDAARGAGVLAIEDEACGACEAAVWESPQLGGGEEPLARRRSRNSASGCRPRLSPRLA